MRSRSVGLVTRDPALYAELAGALRERRTPTVSLLPGQRIPDRVAVVLTSPDEVGLIVHPRVLAVAEGGDRASLWAAVESALASDPVTGDLVVGFDPGPRPGYAVLSGTACLIQGILGSPEDAARLGTHLRHRFPGRGLLFRVGSGDRFARNRIVNSLLPLRRPVEIVDEQGTTPRGHRRPRDAAAAGAIARTPGRPAKVPSALTATPGEIANLQRLSRVDSGGQLTISREAASRVLHGEITMGQAIEDRAPRPESSPVRRSPVTRGAAREHS